ncbi:MAG: hydantoinase/oxoprolinase family protein [Granulosicoccus sp.]
MLRLAIDIGGTFTDVVAETEDGLSSIKVLTSSDGPETAALAGIAVLLDRLSSEFNQIDSVVHGTTLATNALIERRGAQTAFITTAGFRDVLEMRNEKRFDQYELNIELPKPLIPRPLRYGIQERTLADGSVRKRPDDAEIDSLCQELLKKNIDAIAIGFLHAYRNNTNEQYVASRIRDNLGNSVTICQSAEVSGEIREFDRFSTVCANAYVRPLMTNYLSRLESELKTLGFHGSFLMMLSDGALTTLEQAKRFPIRLIEGGPAGGVALGAHVARELHSDRTLSLDIGGTTAKICFIKNGKPQTSRCFEVARSWRDIKGSGLPITVPTVELVEIGAGGGSIASVDSLGRLKTGPQSAGSAPGPACYKQGGKHATVTDAHMVTGGIVAEGFAEGMIDLDPQLATDALREEVQTALNFASVTDAAAGVIELANEAMANAARVHGIELGLDVSNFDLLVSGGGGGIHATRIAEKLGINRIFVPSHAGVGSAVGFLRSPIAFETALSVVESIATINYKELDKRLQASLIYVRDVVSQAAELSTISTTVTAELRYCGQGLELRIPLQYDIDLQTALLNVQSQFIDQYQAISGFTLTDIDIELVSLSVAARDHEAGNHPPKKLLTTKPSPATTTVSTRDVYDQRSKAFNRSVVVQRSTLNSEQLSGPIVVSESQTTTIVPRAWCVHQVEQGHLILERA